jgi:hypothetical protein
VKCGYSLNESDGELIRDFMHQIVRFGNSFGEYEGGCGELCQGLRDDVMRCGTVRSCVTLKTDECKNHRVACCDYYPGGRQHHIPFQISKCLL